MMYGKIKPGVRIGGIRPEMAVAITLTMSVFHAHGVRFVITSCVDGKHSRKSKHYSGCAMDIRSREIPEGTEEPLHVALTKALGVDYDVVVESDHWHIEYDPKTGINL